MRADITPDNPHGCDRYGFAWQHIPPRSTAHLDVGCYDGVFLNTLRSKGIARLVGVDISRDAVSKANALFPDLDIIHISKRMPLPFDDGLFTSITVLDVLEHVDEQDVLIEELYRVLKDDGVLIVTVPARHLFSFLDIGNFKFRFPKLHKWHYCRKHTVAEYDYRYVSNPDSLVGDVSARKRWHQHFSREDLSKLLSKGGFRVVVFDGAGFFFRAIVLFGLLTFRRAAFGRALGKARSLDARYFSSANLFCVAVKREAVEVKASSVI